MLKGKVAVVTGSTSGIGLGIARALASAGADVLLNGFGPREQIDALCSELAKGGIRAAYSPADMSKADEIEAMIAFATCELGRVDIVVNNAGIQHTAPVEEFPVDRWDAIIAINLSAAFHAIRAALPQMKTRGWGRIINISSVHGLVASSNKAAAWSWRPSSIKVRDQCRRVRSSSHCSPTCSTCAANTACVD